MNKKEKFFNFRKTFKTIFEILSWTCIVLLMIVGGILIYYVITAKQYESRNEKYYPKFALYTIISPSMEPSIKVYDVIVSIRQNDPNKLKVGDVITFISTSQISNDLTVTHRITEVVKNGDEIKFKTKGDNNSKEDDGYALASNILGKVYLRIPQLGRVQFLLATKGGWFIIVLFPAMAIIIYDLLKLFKLFNLKDKVTKITDKPVVNEEEQKLKEEQRKTELKDRLNIIDQNYSNINSSLNPNEISNNNQQIIEKLDLPKLKDDINNNQNN